MILPDGERSTKATWGPAKAKTDPDPVIGWADFWTELKRCGREGWPQLIRLPELMVKPGDSYECEQLAWLFNRSMTNPSVEWEAREVRLITLEPNDEGNYFTARMDPDELVGTAANVTNTGAEDHRTVVFLDLNEMVLQGLESGTARNYSNLTDPH
jgi:hypothetical protein